jgi:hypothetical protein
MLALGPLAAWRVRGRSLVAVRGLVHLDRDLVCGCRTGQSKQSAFKRRR